MSRTAASLQLLPPSPSITNIDPEHIDHYGSLALQSAFVDLPIRCRSTAAPFRHRPSSRRSLLPRVHNATSPMACRRRRRLPRHRHPGKRPKRRSRLPPASVLGLDPCACRACTAPSMPWPCWRSLITWRAVCDIKRPPLARLSVGRRLLRRGGLDRDDGAAGDGRG